jgi:hypothetical protein
MRIALLKSDDDDWSSVFSPDFHLNITSLHDRSCKDSIQFFLANMAPVSINTISPWVAIYQSILIDINSELTPTLLRKRRAH